MGDVIQFPSKPRAASTEDAVFVSGVREMSQAERMERIKASLLRINELMEQLRQTTRRGER